jgi:hypothetical protein
MNAPLRPQALVALPELKEVRTKDQTGRPIITFEGKPSMWLRDFAGEPRRIRSIRTRSHA